MDLSLWLWSLFATFLMVWAVNLAAMSMFLISTTKVAFIQRVMSFILMFAAVMVVMINGGS